MPAFYEAPRRVQRGAFARLAVPVTFLETGRGKPFSAASFVNWFRDRCNEAGLEHCTCHGLRKAGDHCCRATTNQLMAIFDWTSPHQAEVYTRKADRRKLAAEGMKLRTRD